jgi:hypothetical protein
MSGGEPGFEAIFLKLEQESVKVSSYFAVYDAVLAKYKGKKDLVLVEIGVMNGGSLFMWRSFFGGDARIIGIDFSPTAVAMRDKGFEIFIGDQASPEFWRDFFSQVGNIDVLIDDGGHTNKHQISTVEYCLDHINDGGMILVEDACTSYMREFGNPSRYSFINYCKALVDRIQARGPSTTGIGNSRFSDSIFSMSFFESIVCFNVDRRLCGKAKVLRAGHEVIGALNYWNVDKRLVDFERGRKAREWLRSAPPLVEKTVVAVYARLNALVMRLKLALENRRLRRFF